VDGIVDGDDGDVVGDGEEVQGGGGSRSKQCSVFFVPSDSKLTHRHAKQLLGETQICCCWCSSHHEVCGVSPGRHVEEAGAGQQRIGALH